MYTPVSVIILIQGPTEKETSIMWAPCQKIFAVFIDPTMFVFHIYYTAVHITFVIIQIFLNVI